MDNERKKVSYITSFLREFATIFSLTVLVMSLAGKVIADFDPELQNTSTLFALGGTGLPYAAILQIAGFSLIIAAFSRLLFSDYLVLKLPYILRAFLFFLAALLTISNFAIFFKWFPTDNPQAWLRFIFSFFVCFVISIALSLFVLKLEDKKYNKLLEEYKNRHKK